MTAFDYGDALTLRDAAKAIRDGAEWTPMMVEAVASLLDVAAEDIASAELRGASWARWEWTHYCFAVAAQALSDKRDEPECQASESAEAECKRLSKELPEIKCPCGWSDEEHDPREHQPRHPDDCTCPPCYVAAMGGGR